MASFSIGTSKAESVRVTVNNYERAITGEYYDDNWVAAEVSISVGAFSGHFSAAFLTPDFVQFRSTLQSLCETLKGEAVFSTLEEQLSIKLTVDDIGHLEVQGVAIDHPGMGNELKFTFDLDQTYLPKIMSDLDEIITLFPIRS
jgi:hypothetical protein